MNPAEATDYAVRRQLCRLTEADIQLISDLGGNFAREIPSIVEEFYGHLSEFEFLRGIVAKHTTIPKLKQTFATYCE